LQKKIEELEVIIEAGKSEVEELSESQEKVKELEGLLQSIEGVDVLELHEKFEALEAENAALKLKTKKEKYPNTTTTADIKVRNYTGPHPEAKAQLEKQAEDSKKEEE
jgi:hypothetical protein